MVTAWTCLHRSFFCVEILWLVVAAVVVQAKLRIATFLVILTEFVNFTINANLRFET